MNRAVAPFRRTARPGFTLAANGLHRWVALLMVLGALLAASTAEADLNLYVANQKGEGDTHGRDAIVVYQVTGLATQTNLNLLRTLAGDVTGLATPTAVAVIQNKLFVANRSGGRSGTGSITVYSATAQGNAPWEAILEGVDTELDAPSGLVVTETELFVANQSPLNKTPSITVYRWSTAPQGNVVFDPPKPVRRIKGGSTGLDGPGFLALDRTNDELFASNNYGGTVTVYKRSDSDDQRYRRRLIQVGFVGFPFPTGVAVDPVNNEVFLAYGFGVGTGTIGVWPRTASDDPPLAPKRALSGPVPQVDNDAPNGIALDVANDRFFVAHRGTDNFPGAITAHTLTWTGFSGPVPLMRLPPLTPVPPPPQEIFSPVALALVDTSSVFDFALAVTPPAVTAGRGSPFTVTVTATVSGGAGRVTFKDPQSIGASGGFDADAFCDFSGPGSCSKTLRMVAGSSLGPFSIIVQGTGTPTVCGNRDARADGPCDVVREASFTLTISEQQVPPPPGILRVLKPGTGRCAVTSVPAGLTCGLDQIDCSAQFPVSSTTRTATVTLTAAPDASSSLTGWNYDNCTPQQSCSVLITSGTTTTVPVRCDLVQVPPATAQLSVVNLQLGGRGTVTSDLPGISCDPVCAGTFNVGTSITLRPTPGVNPPGVNPVGANSVFVGWGSPCAGFDSFGQPHIQCTVPVTANGASVDAWFVATLRDAFVARLYLNVLPGTRPTLQNVNDLVTSVAVSPLLSVQALVDAFFDGPNRPKRPALSAADYVRVVVRALLWREPTQSEIDIGAQFLSPTTSSPDAEQLVAERQLRSAVIEGSEFKALIGSVFGTSGP